MAEPQTGQELLYLTEAETVALLPSAGAVADQIALLIAGLRNGSVTEHPKAVTGGGDMATFFIMSAGLSGDKMGIKWLGGAPDNPQKGIPAFLGINILSDAVTGAPIAISGAARATVLRTAALSLLGARAFAAPEARTLGLVGAGMQAAAHLQAMQEEFPIDHVLVSSIGDTAQAFANRHAALGLSIEAVEPDRLLAEADIIVSAVAADPGLVPYLDARRMRPGTFAAMIDLGKPWTTEGLSAFDRVYTDNRQSSLKRGLSVAQMGAVDYAGDLADLCGGPVTLYDPALRSAFLFAGTPIADFAVSLLVYRAALASGAGRVMPL